jgi:hypothetical protein
MIESKSVRILLIREARSEIENVFNATKAIAAIVETKRYGQ